MAATLFAKRQHYRCRTIARQRQSVTITMLAELVRQGFICDGCRNTMRNLPHLDRLCISSVTIKIFLSIFGKI